MPLTSGGRNESLSEQNKSLVRRARRQSAWGRLRNNVISRVRGETPVSQMLGVTGPDSYDPRDRLKPIPVGQADTEFDLSRYVKRITNQGEMPSCTGFGGRGMMELLITRMYKGDKSKTPNLSAAWPWWYAREMRGSRGQKTGAQVRDLCKVLHSQGCVGEYHMPDRTHYTSPPTPAALTAPTYKLEKYERIPSTFGYELDVAGEAVRKVISREKLPVLCGYYAFNSHNTRQVRATGILPVPGPVEPNEGGHLVYITGYTLIDGEYHYKFANSWGTHWGENGYGFLPEGFFRERLVFDLWVPCPSHW